jgi:hypothetical protein
MKYNLIALACAILLALGLSLTVTAGPSEPDSDLDLVVDCADDCNPPHPQDPDGSDNLNQADSDKDGYGQICDGDYNNDGKTNTSDFTIFKASFSGTYDEQCDHNCDGKVNTTDFTTFKALFNAAQLGSSGQACAAGNDKGNCPANPGCP